MRPERCRARKANGGIRSGPRGRAVSWDSRPMRSRKSHSPSIPGRPGPPSARPAPATRSRAPHGDSPCRPGAPNSRGRPALRQTARAPDRRAGWSRAPHSLLRNRETLWFLRLFRLFAVYPPRSSCQPQKTGSEARKPVFHNGFAVPLGTHRIRTVQRPPVPRSQPRELSGNRCETHSTWVPRSIYRVSQGRHCRQRWQSGREPRTILNRLGPPGSKTRVHSCCAAKHRRS